MTRAFPMADRHSPIRDKAGKAYWDGIWNRRHATTAHAAARELNDVHRKLRAFLRTCLSSRDTGARLLELGCAHSSWLPFFARDLGFVVSGIDYSDHGCALARETLAAQGVAGEIVCADFFEPPSSLLGAFDVAVSFGVVEHFEDTAACVRSFARFLSPQGRLVTLVPNLCGVLGFVQKHINRPVFEKHVPLDPQRLAAAHAAAGLLVQSSGLLVSTNFGILNLEGLPRGTPGFFSKRALVAALGRVSRLAWFVEELRGRELPKLVATAAHVYCVADVPPSAIAGP